MEKLTDEICSKLDTVLLEYMSLISRYQENWQQISKDLEDVSNLSKEPFF
jgi:hypothetical protein